MSEWVAETGEDIIVRETGLYIDGEYLPDKPKPDTEGTTHGTDA